MNTFVTGEMIKATKTLSFAWPKPDSAQRVSIIKDEIFMVRKVSDAGLALLIDGKYVIVKPKCFIKCAPQDLVQ